MKLIKILALVMLASCSGESNKLIPRDDGVLASEKVSNVTFNPQIDILFVIDNSGSMSDHQRNLSNNIDLFIGEFVKLNFLDFHIGVIHTDKSDARTKGLLLGDQKYVEKTTPNLMYTLKSNIIIGSSGYGYEASFDLVKLALTEPRLSRENAGFYRPNAILVTIFITDAEEQSDILDPQDYWEFLLNLKKQNINKLANYGVIIPVNDKSCPRQGEYPPYRYEEFFALSGGKYFGLCDKDFGIKLANMGDDLRQLVSIVELNSIPVVDTIEVKYGKQIIPNHPIRGWTYDPKLVAIRFGKELEFEEDPNAELSITFVKAEQNN